MFPPVRLTFHDHKDCEDLGYVVDTGLICDACKALWWQEFAAEAATETATPPPP